MDEAFFLEATFLGVGVAIVLPFILGYTVYSYRVSRGKVREGQYEH